MSIEKKRYWYVLIIVATFLLAVIGMGIGNGTKSQYVKPICDTFGWARTQYTAMFSIADFTMFLGNVFFVVALKVFRGIRNVFLVGVLALLAAFAVFYNMNSLWMLYVGGILFGVQAAYINTAAYSAVINNWFVKNKGTALGIIFAGTGVGSMIYNLVTGYMIQNYGWRASYGLAMIVVLVLALIAFAIFRSKPSDLGLPLYGEGEVDSSGTEEKHKEFGLTLKEALKQPFYWMSSIGLSLLVICIMGTLINVPGFLGSHKVSPMIIGSLISISYGVNIFCKIAVGWANDRVGLKPILIFTTVCFLLSLLIISRYTTGGSTSIYYAYAVLLGVGMVTISVPVPLIVGKLYGNKDFPAIMGTVMAIFSAGAVLSGPSGSYFYDKMGSYVPAFYFYIVVTIIALMLIFIAMAMSKKVIGENKGW